MHITQLAQPGGHSVGGWCPLPNTSAATVPTGTLWRKHTEVLYSDLTFQKYVQKIHAQHCLAGSIAFYRREEDSISVLWGQ